MPEPKSHFVHAEPRHRAAEHFSLEDLDIDPTFFIASTSDSFTELPLDHYDVRLAQIRLLRQYLPERADFIARLMPEYFLGNLSSADIQPLLHNLAPEQRDRFGQIAAFRRRAIARFRLCARARGHWDVREVSALPFYQAVDDDGQVGDYRALPRTFAPLDSRISQQPIYRQFLAQIAQRVSARQLARVLTMTAHHIRCFVDDENDTATNSPEGIHQDGADYIVSALVVERYNVSGGISKIYDDSAGSNTIFSACLDAGEGLLQPDRGSPLWHEVTPIFRTDPSLPVGYRSIIGVDIDVS